MADSIEIDEKDTTEVRQRVDRLRRDPALEEALTTLAVNGVQALTSVEITGPGSNGRPVRAHGARVGGRAVEER